MAFMEPQIEQGQWYEIDTDNGITFVPVDVVGDVGLEWAETANDWSQDERQGGIVAAMRDYCEATPHEVRMIQGWGARLSAPGYMDCTEWSVFETEQEARDYLRDELGADDDEEPDDTDDDGPMFSVVEYSSFFAVRHNPSGREHPMGDGVDTLFGADGKALWPGTEGFIEAWEGSLNANPDEILEAYFPDLADDEA